jgi:hypothetical protein
LTFLIKYFRLIDHLPDEEKNVPPMNFIKKCYLDLLILEYSEENIAELFSIANRIIKFLKSKNPSRKTNKALHFVTLTKERVSKLQG